MPDFTMTVGARLPSLIANLYDGNGPMQLSGSTVSFYMAKNGVVEIAGSSCTIVDPMTGQVRYDWASTDTDTPGLFFAQFCVTTGGKKQFVPDNGYLEVLIQPAM